MWPGNNEERAEAEGAQVQLGGPGALQLLPAPERVSRDPVGLELAEGWQPCREPQGPLGQGWEDGQPRLRHGQDGQNKLDSW